MSKQVLVMGGSYFIGKRVVEALLAQDYAVFTLNRGTRPTANARVANLVCVRPMSTDRTTTPSANPLSLST